MLTFDRKIDGQPADPPLPPLAESNSAGAYIEVGGSWHGRLEVVGADCGPLRARGSNSILGWEYYSKSENPGPAGSPVVRISWGINAPQRPTLAISFSDEDDRVWEAAVTSETSPQPYPGATYQLSQDRRSVVFTGAGVATGTTVERISWVTIAGSITCLTPLPEN